MTFYATEILFHSSNAFSAYLQLNFNLGLQLNFNLGGGGGLSEIKGLRNHQIRDQSLFIALEGDVGGFWA